MSSADTIMAGMIAFIAIVSILGNVWLANACRYYKSSARIEEHQVYFWYETALLYQKQMHEAEARHWKTLDELSERV